MNVSIALASFNGECFIREQLDSFTRQTRLPDELVITDDGSSDRTEAIVADFARSAPFPVHFHRNQQRLGYARNFERAIGMCTGDVIFLSDQDDVWFADKIATVTSAVLADPEAMVIVNDQTLTDAQLCHDGHTKLSNLRRLGIGSDGLIEGCCTALRRSWADLILPIPADHEHLVARRLQSHDRWINELAILLGVRRVIEFPLQYFRRTGSNTTDWIVSEPRRIGMFDLLAETAEKAPVSAWSDRIEVLDHLERWIFSNKAKLERAGVAGTGAAMAAIESERLSMARRSSLAARPWPRRAVGVFELWTAGGYRYFNGWKSALLDLVRPA